MKHRVLAALSAILFIGSSRADAQVLKLRTTVINDQRQNLIESVKLSGDVRLRHETFNKRTGTNAARQRQRFRFRLGSAVALPYYFSVNAKLASGVGEQVSTNQSFDDLGSQKGIFIDQLYLKYKPYLSDEGSLSFAAGKIKNPMWMPYSADAVFDGDWNPEGMSQSIEWFVAPLGGIYFANALQTAVDEDSSSEADQYLFSTQIGAEYRLPFQTRLRVAGAFHEWVNERASTLGQTALNEGNRRITTAPNAGALANDFGVAEISGEFTAWPRGSQLRAQGTWIKNTAHVSTRLGAGDTARDDMGYQVGAILGEASLAKTWEFGYFYKWLETDATVADAADSDFGDGGTNRRGHLGWIAYSPLDWMQIKAKFFYVKVIDEMLAPGKDDINRTQLDLVVKF
ncbi:MAG: hypothetical protein AUJ52_12810 [Elusimicrobia bacterium CG1_02_63_36]|nr:MAG: hypothetical protein AUJ52_12810 [Elusimicrobia bacterium CG1_02_63_36]PIP83924.1 MAG: hypothetical protein COR54_06770 [Elusimicrobia bacterium CG22_combo_CG10-13_8_21_14_all_63_91]PJA14881.1 MAG: hypothetical protein COX66_11460 [Elusimicrobia bacterium CG_4_10_14_0_2_um_filter_63_34]PJB26713.1 MAG: hypothetical protein CO113_02090 [Elusimicrobia bacterium CG_4_9_14_3_um_filter_62_55]